VVWVLQVRVAEDLGALAAASSAAGRCSSPAGLVEEAFGRPAYAADLVVASEVGEPRPRSHSASSGTCEHGHGEHLRVRVGNLSVSPCAGGGSMVRVSATVDNVAKGAWGNALDIADRIVASCRENVAAGWARNGKCPCPSFLPPPPPHTPVDTRQSRRYLDLVKNKLYKYTRSKLTPASFWSAVAHR
jgi:hypothetical protein